MVKDIRPQVENFKTEDWLNAVRNVSSNEYRERVPEATQANIEDTVKALWDLRATRNQFIDGLINRIGMQIYRNISWTNPLGKFKRGMLTYGETIQEIMAGLLEASSYDPTRDELEKEIFGAMTPEVQVSYHSIDRNDRYKLTVKEPDLRRAFLSSNGLSQFVTNLMSMLQNSDQWDEYLIMSRLFKMFDDADGFFNINVVDLSVTASDNSVEARGMLKELKRMGNTLPYISRVYNPAGLPVSVNRNDLELFISASADATIDVDALAAAFNIGKADFASRKTVLPDGAFDIDGAQAVLTTRDLFVCADSLLETTSIFNPATLANNYWLHHRGVYSMSRFAPAVLFSTRPSTIIGAVETPVTALDAPTVNEQAVDGTWSTVTKVERGKTYNVFANATTTPTGGDNDAVFYNLTGTVPMSAFTYITNNGDLKIGPDEENTSLTVNVVAVDDVNFTNSVTVTVFGDRVTPWPNPEVIPDSDSDGLLEVTPVKPDFTNNVIKIPSVTGVQYKNGATNVNNGVEIPVASGSPVTINAAARTGYELATGAPTTWTFTFA